MVVSQENALLAEHLTGKRDFVLGKEIFHARELMEHKISGY